METIRKSAQRKLCPEELLKIYDSLYKNEKKHEKIIPRYRECWRQLDKERLDLLYAHYRYREARKYIQIHKELPTPEQTHLLGVVSLAEDILVDKKLWHYDSGCFRHLKIYCCDLLQRKTLPQAELEIREHLDDLKEIIRPILKTGEYK